MVAWMNAIPTDINQEINNLIQTPDTDEIILTGRHLFGVLPDSLGDLINLRRLFLNDNSITGEIPDNLNNLQQLVILFLDHNQISGTIPGSISFLTNLRHLNLSHNQLTGTIPNNIGDLNNLYYLSLSNNQLQGHIPTSICNLILLSQLHLNDNQLTGSIPNNIGQLNNLYIFSLQNNQISGSIPESIGNLHNIRRLYLNNNNLTGVLPRSIINLGLLTHIDTTGNNMRSNRDHLSTYNTAAVTHLKNRLRRRANMPTYLCSIMVAHPDFYGNEDVQRHIHSFNDFGKIMKPYKKFIVQNNKNKKKGLYFKTRFGVQKLRDDAVGLYLKGNRKMYLHRW